jgi:VWFA-related protein
MARHSRTPLFSLAVICMAIAALMCTAHAGRAQTAPQQNPPAQPAPGQTAPAPATPAQTSPAPAPGQTPPAAQTPPANRNAAETVMHEDEAATFRSHVNLVMVPVVIRDKKGKAIGNLTKQDFQLFDRGKPQEITRFSVEKTGEKPKDVKPEPSPDQVPGEPGQPIVLPDSFIAYLFDDIHIAIGDLVRIRDAARRHMDALGPLERAGIYTTSGQVVQEFTDDREKLHAALARLMPRPIARSMTQDCPDISYYMADMIVNKNMQDAIQAAAADAMACANISGPGAAQQAAQMAQSAAQRVLSTGDQETRVALFTLRDLVRRMAAAPGKRTILLLSPGFYTPEQQTEKMDIFDRAIRANVIISTLDARGLWVDPTFDASQRPVAMGAMRIKAQYDHDAAMAGADVLAEVAYGTGGAFFQNNNDFDEGLRRLATPPDYVYHLGFSPQNLKMDGGYHALKVSLKTASKIPGAELDARKGYYAPTHLENEAENAKREIEEALFSREEMQEIPARMQTQFFKRNDKTANLSVLVHADIRQLKFRKADDRNLDNLTVLAAIFDRNGNFVKGITKLVEFRLKDDTLQNRLGPGINVRTTFDVEPGTYMVRLVLRDSEGHMMSAVNGAVNIPF